MTDSTTSTYANCVYTEDWRGEFPYSSACTATVSFNGKVITKFHFTTNINPKGETDADYCRRWARDYIPASYSLEDVFQFWEKRGYIRADLETISAKGVARITDCFDSYNKGVLSRPLSFLKGWRRREDFRKIYEERKKYKRLLNSQGHILHLEICGINYLEKPF